MKLPCDISGILLAKKLEILGYSVIRQTGSHMRLATSMNGKHDITIPVHSPLKIGTLNSILLDISSHFKISKDDLIKQIF